FAIQAFEPYTGFCDVQVTSTDTTYAGEVFEVEVQPAALRIRGLDVTTTTTSGDDDFYVDVGVARDNLSDLKRTQTVRKGSAGLTVNACSSIISVGTIIGGGSDPYCKTATITATNSATAQGAFKFHPVGTGTTVVSAVAAGLITTDQGSLDV